MKSRFRMMIAIIPFVTAFILWFFQEIDLLCPGASFGGGTWPDLVIWAMGSVTILVSIPLLYASSYQDFKRHNKTWMAKMLLIYPFFLFGMLFQFGSDLYFLAAGTLVLSMLVVLTTNVYSMVISAQYSIKSSYFISLVCLLVYYISLIVLQFSFNLLHFLKYELRYLLEPLQLR